MLRSTHQRAAQPPCTGPATAWGHLRLLLAALALGACSDSNLYTSSGMEYVPPDRVTIAGTLCTEDTGGSRFPVKVLLMVDQTPIMFSADPQMRRLRNAPGSVDAVLSRNRGLPHVHFGFVGVSDLSRPLPPPDGQRFFRPQDPQTMDAVAMLQIPQTEKRDVVNALAQVESFILADIARSSPGETLRSRYLVNMLFAGPPTNTSLSAGQLAEQVEKLKALVLGHGALEFRLNIGLLYYGPRTIDRGDGPYNCFTPEPGDPACSCPSPGTATSSYCGVYCDVASGAIEERRNEVAADAYERMAFGGGGEFRLFPCAASVDFGVGIAVARAQLVKKDIVVFNRNVQLGPDGPLLDSDGDGLADIDELSVAQGSAGQNTDPWRWDTDGDGIGDRLEARAFPRQDPNDPTDRPAACVDPAITMALPDRDIDLLNDCEEGLLQTSATIPDSDGDGLPDSLEFWSGTVPTAGQDRLLDFDADGVPNAEEVIAHTNPRANDAQLRGKEAYRSDVTPLGARQVATMEDSAELRAVSFEQAAANVVGGRSFLRWTPTPDSPDFAGHLQWADARHNSSPPYQPVRVPVPRGQSGVYTLPAQLIVAGADGQPRLVDETYVEVYVVAALLPDAAMELNPMISVSQRSCYEVRVSNVKLLQTEPPADASPEEAEQLKGVNRVLVFFTQAPADRLSSPGVAKVAELTPKYVCRNPAKPKTCTRTPHNGVIHITDSDFVSVVP